MMRRGSLGMGIRLVLQMGLRVWVRLFGLLVGKRCLLTRYDLGR